MPGSIHISATQPPLTTPVFLHVAVGKREYSGNIGQDDFCVPVTSLRDSMVMTLYNTDKELISKTEVKTRTIVELGTTDVVFILHNGGKIILQLQFLLSDEGRKRIQELRNSAMKRKQQELLGNGSELYLQDSPLSKHHAENVFNIPSKGDQLTLRKSMSLDDLKERAVFSGISVDPHMKASRDLLLQSDENTSRLEDVIGSKLGHGKSESRSSSNAVKKMISAFEISSPQGPPSMTRIKSESSLEGMPVSSGISTNSSYKPSTSGASSQAGVVAATPGKVSLPSGDSIGPSSRSGRHVTFGNKKSNASKNTFESRRRSSSRRDEAAKKSAGENELISSKKRSQEKHRRTIGSCSPEQTHSRGLSRYYLRHPLNYLVATSSIWIHPHVCITTASKQLRDLVELEKLNSVYGRLDVREDTEEATSHGEARSMRASNRRLSDGFPVQNGWLINQGVRIVIVVIACGAVFLNNR